MAKSVNIYSVSRIRDEYTFGVVLRHQSQIEENYRTQYHEVESLRSCVDALMEHGVSVEDLDGFNFGYHIPRIGKEFDLLKITDRVCLNIELKSQEVPREQMREQLLKNRYYLSHMGKRLHLYTINTGSLHCYKLSLTGELADATLDEIAAEVKKNREGFVEDIDVHFKASKYLVSPFTTPEKFIQGEYFLTLAQEQIKKQLLEDVDGATGNSYYHITGKPGTGKTLLLYDTARALSRNGDTLLIHCGALNEGQRIISEKVPGLNIVSTDVDLKGILPKYSFVLVDEVHRMDKSLFTQLVDLLDEETQVCIFSSDPEQILTLTEKNNDIVGQIRALPFLREFVLSEKIRMNSELHNFIVCLKNPEHAKENPRKYPNVDINYANTTAEAQNLIEYYKSKGYTFINYAIPWYEPSPYAQYEETFDIQHVIGQEYDKVVMLMDASFYYGEDGRLVGIPCPDPEYQYPNLFYQGVTRVREKLGLIIVDAPELFERISTILEGAHERSKEEDHREQRNSEDS